jgi:cyclase
MKQLTDNVFIEMSFPGCNVGIVTTREGIVMIDTPMCPTDAMKWREEVSKTGKVRYLINTDEHLDHNSYNYLFSGTVIAHQAGREALLARPVEEVMGLAKAMEPAGFTLVGQYEKKLPDITFTEDLNLYVGNHTFELIPLPGHAPGVIGVYIPEERVVFVSDNVFYREKTWAFDCTPDQWLYSLKKISQLEVEVIVPGHGLDICGKQYLQEQAGIIENWVQAVKKAVEEGLNEEQAVRRVTCPDPYPLPKVELAIMSELLLNKMIVSRLHHVLSGASQPWVSGASFKEGLKTE